MPQAVVTRARNVGAAGWASWSHSQAEGRWLREAREATGPRRRGHHDLTDCDALAGEQVQRRRATLLR